MLSFLQKIREQGKLCSHTKDLAQAYLDATDYISNKCYELGLVVADRYPNEFAWRGVARQIGKGGVEMINLLKKHTRTKVLPLLGCFFQPRSGTTWHCVCKRKEGGVTGSAGGKGLTRQRLLEDGTQVTRTWMTRVYCLLFFIGGYNG